MSLLSQNCSVYIWFGNVILSNGFELSIQTENSCSFYKYWNEIIQNKGLDLIFPFFRLTNDSIYCILYSIFQTLKQLNVNKTIQILAFHSYILK